MITYIIIGVIVLGIAYKVIKDKKDKKDSGSQPSPVTPDPVNPSHPYPPKGWSVGRWCYIDDSILSLENARAGGDPNSTKAAKLNIPVYEGHNGYSNGDSPLAREIIKHSSNSKLTICCGSPVNDLRDALQLGAKVHNIRLYALLHGGWNGGETHTGSLRQDRTAKTRRDAANYVRSKLGGYNNVRRGDGKTPFDPLPNNHPWQPKGKGLLDKYTDIPSFKKAMSPSVRSYCKELNHGKSELRIADFSAVDAAFGHNWKDGIGAANRVEEGLRELRKL